MVKVKVDLTGKRFGKFIVIKRVDDYIMASGKHKDMWLCLCDCGHYVQLVGSEIRRKKENSGCRFCQTLFIRKNNRYDIDGEYGIGWTTNTQEEFYFDLEDYDVIKQYCWFVAVCKRGYKELRAKDTKTNKLIRMHCLLVGKYADHINRNTLDNRRQNLRQCTEQENLRNRGLHKTNKSGVTGVCWNKQRQVWLAYITVDNKNIYLGGYNNKEDAITTRLEAEKKYFGEFAPQQHLYEQYGIK